MKREWEKINAKLEAMSLRERVYVFVATAFLIVFLVNYWLLEPLMARQKSTRMQVTQQHTCLFLIHLVRNQKVLQTKLVDGFKHTHQQRIGYAFFVKLNEISNEATILNLCGQEISERSEYNFWSVTFLYV